MSTKFLLIFLGAFAATAQASGVTVSWDSNTEADLDGYKIYYGTESRTYDQVVDLGNETSVTFSELQLGTTYFFAVTAYDLVGNESTFSEEVSATLTPADTSDSGDGDNDGGNTDLNPPRVVAVVPRGETQIDVIFSEPVDRASAENLANYAIDNDIRVVGAILDEDPTVVHLVTTAHERGVNHIITVTNVKDQNGNSVPPQSAQTYNIPDPARDREAPEVLYVSLKDNNKLELIFNESVRYAEAEDVNNYAINNGIEVTSATLRSNQSIVDLVTSAHAPGSSYTLTVSNVRDLVGNRIGDKNSYAYQTEAEEEKNTDTVAPRIASVKVKGETQVDVQFSEPVARASAENPRNYHINKSIEIKGAILSENQSTVHLVTSNHEYGVEYTVAVSNVKDIAGNAVSQDNTGAYSLKAVEDITEDNGVQNPSSFSLFQNYPNPFNPETEIRFYLDADRRLDLKVYNQLGQVVKTLVNYEMPAGYHTIVWDGTNDDGLQVPSGVYIYSLEVTRNVMRGDLLVNVSLERRVKRMTLLR